MDIAVLIQSVQYLLPVTIAILGLSIFLFGFQSVKEPDYSYINSIVTTRKKKQLPKKNGIVVAPKPTTPVIGKAKIEQPAKAVNTIGKENAQPAKKPKKPVEVDDSADLEQGDWLPAPVRGAANRKAAAAVAKQQPQASPKKAKAVESPRAKKQQPVLKEVQNKVEAEVDNKADEVLAQKKVGKKQVAAAPFTEVLEESTVETVVSSVVTSIAEVELKQEAKKGKKVEEGAGAPDSPDLWEESKSRGTKKKARARKD